MMHSDWWVMILRNITSTATVHQGMCTPLLDVLLGDELAVLLMVHRRFTRSSTSPALITNSSTPTVDAMTCLDVHTG